jgi:hypothetical protein
MSTCAACGHEPVAGPFCTRCGSATAPSTPPPQQPPQPQPQQSPQPPQPQPQPSSFAPPAAPVSTPSVPTAGSSPPPARFPLFADETGPDDPPPARFALYADESPTTAPPATAATPVAERPPPPAPPPARRRERAATWWLPWVLGVLFVALIATVGVLLLSGGDSGAGSASDNASEAAGDDPGAEDLTGRAEATVPKPARASTDNQGNRVTYGAANLFDGEATTCWRTAGDAAGKVLVFRFDEPVTITEVGLINGYAKNDPPNDWYTANRRVLEAQWSFGSGDPVRQTLEESRDLQTIDVDSVETREVRLRLVQVSPPGGRDYTAISEVALRGQ